MSRDARSFRTTALLSLCLAATAAWAAGCGSSEPPPPTGEVLFVRHCASCHGTSGKGDGPLAATLKTPPANLTLIAKRGGGRFDDAEVMAMIDGRRAVAAHGPREMPVWGAVFAEELRGKPRAGYVVLLHGRALTDYVRSLQEP